MNTDLPAAYQERMNALLGEGYEDFLACYQNPAVNGLRVNTLKISTDDFQNLSPFVLEPVSWCPEGFRLLDEAAKNPGKHPLHAAGLYYLQDPSAMAAARILSPQPGELVLDLAAAPGGKTTHLAALMRNQGVLVANEIHPRRVWDLAENLERCGVTNTAILNETPQRLADHFGAIFDHVLVDAPCSGEGMFRKSEEAVLAWSPELVRGCASRQKEILLQAARLVRPGGTILYATCTFSLEENEMVVSAFVEMMKERGEVFVPLEIPTEKNFHQGMRSAVNCTAPIEDQLSRCIRLWPHLQGAEGHFLALIKRVDGKDERIYFQNPQSIPETDKQLFQKFCQETLKTNFISDRLHLQGNYIYQLPEKLPDLRGLRIIHPGWWLGAIKINRFEPSHALALGMPSEGIKTVEGFPAEGETITRYLGGEPIQKQGPPGWTAVGVKENERLIFILGWGKRSQDTIKNSYPRGLRWI